MTTPNPGPPHEDGLIKRATFSNQDWATFRQSYEGFTYDERLSVLQEFHKMVMDMRTAIAFLNQISGELDIDKLMDMIRSMALELLSCERVTLFLVDEIKQELRGKTSEELEEPIIRVKFGEGIAGRVAQTGESLNVKDAYECSHFSSRTDQLTGFTTKTILCCPIRDSAGKNIAVLEAVNKKEGCFTWNDESTLNLFVLQIGNTLEKSRLHRKAINEGAKIARLSNYTKQMHNSRNLDVFLNLSREAICELVEAKFAFVFLRDTARSQLWSKVETTDGHYSILRLDTNTGVFANCLEDYQPRRLGVRETADFELEKLRTVLGDVDFGEVLIHPIARDPPTQDNFGLVIAVNKAPIPSVASILYEDSFTQADEAILRLFCKDLHELLLERIVEVSFASALSIVTQEGTNANEERRTALLQSQLMEYSDVGEAFMTRLGCFDSARSVEVDSILHTLIACTYRRGMASQKSQMLEASATPVFNEARKRIELGPVDQIRTWMVDFIGLPNEELVKMAYDLFRDLLSGLEFEIKDETLVCFLTAVASHYRDNPYHNFLHACYVFHAVWMILKETNIEDYLLPHDQLALCIAALCHDVDHTGFTNQYHINIGSEVAKRYNEVSVLENHHCALSFAILERRNCAILDGLHKDIQSEIRKTMIKLILATDMTNHFKMTSELCQIELPEGRCDETLRLLLCKAVLHAADISNPVRSFKVDYWMSDRVQREFKIQTEKEKELGLPVSPHMDIQNEVMKYQAEVNFIDFIVTPLWKRLAQLFPQLEICILQSHSNKTRFEEMVLQAST